MTFSNTPPAVVLNTHYSGLGIARNLGPLGVRVLGLTAFERFPGNRSRWLEFVHAPDSLQAPAALADALEALAVRIGPGAVLFPTRDHDINFLQAHRARLQSHFRIALAPPDVVETALNKDRLFEVARSAGLALPQGLTVTQPADLEAARVLPWPCICKPLYAAQWRKPGIWDAVGRRKAVRVDSFEAFEQFYQTVAPFEPVMSVQQWIPGGEDSLQIFGSYCDASHRVQASFTARKLLQVPALMGTGVVVEALRLPELEAPSRALLAALRFEGVSEIEYKRDPRDGRLYLIEINPRHWDQHRLGAVVGVNLSEAAYREACGLPPRAMQQQEGRVRWIADPDFARFALGALRHPRRLPDVFGLMRGARTWAYWDRDDPRPTYAVLAGAQT